ncbi:probable G-protein coupled receptor Mth-like 12 [Drosophila suzukii]|uniref:Probable G-protein coupled receptor Mth-like 12 n=1 Tax=Drosophila suzukii TaxID=28584 RepID=A0ABM4TRR1_DROSZ
MSYHLWRTFKSANGEEPRFLFLAYNVSVWVPTAVLPGGTVLCIYSNLITIGSKVLLCAILALLLLNFFTLTMFILTINHILKLKRQTVKLRQGDEETTTCLNLDSETYLYCLRILFVIGLHWCTLTEGISWGMNLRHPVLDVIFGLMWGGYGIWYFILLILNRYTLRLLMDRFRGSTKQQFVRAQMVKSPA